MTSGNYEEVPESSCLGNPTQSRIIKSYQHFQELRTLPSSLFTYWELPVTGDSIMPGTITCSCNAILCPSSILQSLSWHRRAPNWFRSIWDWLQSSPYALLYCWHLLPDSPSGVPDQTLLFYPCSFQSDILLRQHGCESVHCPGTHWELCVVSLRANRSARIPCATRLWGLTHVGNGLWPMLSHKWLLSIIPGSENEPKLCCGAYLLPVLMVKPYG